MKTSVSKNSNKQKPEINSVINRKAYLASMTVGVIIASLFIFGCTLITTPQLTQAPSSNDISTNTPSQPTPTAKIIVVTATTEPTSVPTSIPTPADPDFSIISYDDYQGEEPIIITDRIDNWSASVEPSHDSWNAGLPVDKPVLISGGWCTANEKTLQENWDNMEFQVFIDNYEINLDEFYYEPYKTSDGWWCQGFSAVLTGWTEGEHVYVRKMIFKKDINDGWDDYKAGDYIDEFIVSVEARSSNTADTKFLDKIQSYYEKGYLSSTEGEYAELENFRQEWAQMDWYRWWSYEITASSFVMDGHFSWSTASPTPELSGCGFAFGIDDDGSYAAFLDKSRVVFLNPEGRFIGTTRGKGTVDFSLPAEADFSLIVNSDAKRAYILVNEQFIGEYSFPENADTTGLLGYTLLSGSNRDFGTRCEITATKIWIIK